MKTFACMAAIVGSVVCSSEAATYYLVGDDPIRQSSISGSGDYPGWSTNAAATVKDDGTAGAVAGNDYVVTSGRTLRTDEAQATTFLGDLLTFEEGRLLNMSQNIRVDRLAVARSGLLTYQLSGLGLNSSLTGDVSVGADGVFTVKTVPSTSASSLAVNAPVHGPGTVRILFEGEFKDDLAQTAVTLFKVDGFRGPLEVLGLSDQLCHLYVETIPQDCESPNPRGLVISQASLDVRASGTLGPNRGITVEGAEPGKIFVHEGYTVTAVGPLTAAAGTTLKKSGPGTLILTHASPDFKGTLSLLRGKTILRGDAVRLYDDGLCVVDPQATFELDRKSDLVYVDKVNGSDDKSRFPFNTPETACKTLAGAVGVVNEGGTIQLVANQTWGAGDITADPLASAPIGVTIRGAADHSTVFSALNVTIPVNSGYAYADLVFDSVRVKPHAGSLVSNCVVRAANQSLEAAAQKALIADGGRICDTVIENFSYRGVTCDKGDEPVVFERCIVRNGTSPASSSGSHYSPVQMLEGSKGVFVDCVFSNNVCHSSQTAGVFSYGPDSSARATYTLVLDRCRVVGNKGRMSVIRSSADSVGAKDKTADAKLFATNCLFAGNESIACGASTANRTLWFQGEMVNCTVTGNRTGSGKGVFGFVRPDGSDAGNKIVNTVISGNTVGSGGEVAQTYDDSTAINAANSLFPEATTADYRAKDNVAGPAVFVRKNAAELALKRRTPGAEAGDASFWTEKAVDLIGNPRVKGRGADKKVDMGCYQWPVSMGLVFLLK